MAAVSSLSSKKRLLHSPTNLPGKLKMGNKDCAKECQTKSYTILGRIWDENSAP